MPTPPDLIDAFHRVLYGKLTEQLERRVNELASGSAATILGDTQTVAEKYAAQVGYIKAFYDVMGICEQIEQDRYGARKKEEL